MIGIRRENDLLLVVFLGHFLLPFSGRESEVLGFDAAFSIRRGRQLRWSFGGVVGLKFTHFTVDGILYAPPFRGSADSLFEEFWLPGIPICRDALWMGGKQLLQVQLGKVYAVEFFAY